MSERAKSGDPNPAGSIPEQAPGKAGLSDPRYESGPLKNELEDAGPAAQVPDAKSTTRSTDQSGPAAQHRHTTVDPGPRHP